MSMDSGLHLRTGGERVFLPEMGERVGPTEPGLDPPVLETRTGERPKRNRAKFHSRRGCGAVARDPRSLAVTPLYIDERKM